MDDSISVCDYINHVNICLVTPVFSRTFTAPDGAAVGRQSSLSRSSRSTPRVGYYNRSGVLIDEIGNVRTVFELS